MSDPGVTPAAGRQQLDRAALAAHARRIFRDGGIFIALIVLIVVVQSMNSRFFTETNLLNVAQQWAPVGIMAAGMTFVLISGGFDLSVGSTFAFAGVAAAMLAELYTPGVALAGALLLGAVAGAINGFLVTKINVNPFVTTLGMAEVIGGVALLTSDAAPKPVDNALFDTMGSGQVGAVPVSVIVMVAVFLLLGVILARSAYGRSLYAVGGNDEASYLSGVRVDVVRGSTYVIAGVTAALAGVIFAGRVGSGQASAGAGIELDVIAAALIGGISIAGGEGAIWRAAVGVAVLATLQNFFNLADVGDFAQDVVEGAIIILAVALDSYGKRRHRKPLRVVVANARQRLSRRGPPGGDGGAMRGRTPPGA